jgi:hypothetical protein
MAGEELDGPSVATILVRRWRRRCGTVCSRGFKVLLFLKKKKQKDFYQLAHAAQFELGRVHK